jgi:hypothetical protein
VHHRLHRLERIERTTASGTDLGPAWQTAVLQYVQLKVLSGAAGVNWRNFYFLLCPDVLQANEIIDFLRHLLRFPGGTISRVPIARTTALS